MEGLHFALGMNPRRHDLVQSSSAPREPVVHSERRRAGQWRRQCWRGISTNPPARRAFPRTLACENPVDAMDKQTVCIEGIHRGLCATKASLMRASASPVTTAA